MVYITSVERDAIRRGRTEGLKLALAAVLERKFNDIPKLIWQQIENADDRRLLGWIADAGVAESISGIFPIKGK